MAVEDMPATGRTYSDGVTPVPFPAYRCRSTAIEMRDPDNKDMTYTHQCKITADHEDDHACICGRGWPHADDLVKG